MVTVADIKNYLERLDGDTPIVLPVAGKRSLYADCCLMDIRDALDFQPVSLILAEDVDYWELDEADDTDDRMRQTALSWSGRWV